MEHEEGWTIDALEQQGWGIAALVMEQEEWAALAMFGIIEDEPVDPLLGDQEGWEIAVLAMFGIIQVEPIDPLPSVPCSICECRYGTNWELRSHQDSHHLYYKACNFCGVKFPTMIWYYGHKCQNYMR